MSMRAIRPMLTPHSARNASCLSEFRPLSPRVLRRQPMPIVDLEPGKLWSMPPESIPAQFAVTPETTQWFGRGYDKGGEKESLPRIHTVPPPPDNLTAPPDVDYFTWPPSQSPFSVTPGAMDLKYGSDAP